MRRRDVLKALGALPIASALAGCHYGQSQTRPTSNTRVHTLQVWLEGAFAIVLRKDIRRIIAFVPKPDPKRTDLAHYFYYNNPENRKDPARQRPKGYRFQLPDGDWRKYPKPDVDPYVNPDFNDFHASTNRWRLPESLVTLELPFPRSINFTGRPLRVRFAPGARKATGLMPTNAVIEYGVANGDRIKMQCDDEEGHCAESPFCPPGVKRFYFAVGPTTYDPRERRKHAVAFFNFLLESFPDLQKQYALDDIEPVDDGQEQTPYPATRGIAFHPDETPRLQPAVLGPNSPQPRLLRVASMVDCQVGPFLVDTGSGPS